MHIRKFSPLAASSKKCDRRKARRKRGFETFLQILIQLIKIWQHTTNDIYNKDGDKEKDQYANV